MKSNEVPATTRTLQWLLPLIVLVSPAFAQDAPRRGPGFIGVRMTDLDEVSAHDLGLDSVNGVMIVFVLPDSPAQSAGLRPYDVIRGFNGHTVNARADLSQHLRQTSPGDAATLTVIRDAKPLDITLTLGERPQESERTRPELPN